MLRLHKAGPTPPLLNVSLAPPLERLGATGGSRRLHEAGLLPPLLSVLQPPSPLVMDGTLRLLSAPLPPPLERVEALLGGLPRLPGAGLLSPLPRVLPPPLE